MYIFILNVKSQAIRFISDKIRTRKITNNRRKTQNRCQQTSFGLANQKRKGAGLFLIIKVCEGAETSRI